MGKRRAPKAKAAPVTLDNFLACLAVNMAKVAANPDAFAGSKATVGNPVTLAPRVPEAGTWAAKQIQRTMAAGAAWKEGVMHPKKNPVEAAKAANGKYKAKMAAALQADSFLKGLGNVDVDEMYRVIEATGEEVFTGAVQRREGKIRHRIEEIRDDVLALATTIDAMPQDTEAQREARVIANLRGMKAIGQKRRG